MTIEEISDVFKPPPKAILFDLMGTCLDWHSSILPTLITCSDEQLGGFSSIHTKLNQTILSELAIDWREGFFAEIHRLFAENLPPEDIDVTHRRVLDRLLEERQLKWTEEQRQRCVEAWHNQKAWPDVSDALKRLRSAFDVCVLANGSTRLQLDITKYAGVDFDMLFSSQLLGLTKPDPRIYRKVIEEVLGHRPEECVMVAAHAYDLRAAKAVGMKTVYVRRWTEDREENMEQVTAENDLFLDAVMEAQQEGLGRLADMLGT